MDLTLLGGAFLAGILSFISPCVLPLLPTFSLILARSDDDNAGRAVYVNTLAFLVGFTVVFVLLGATASFIGSWLLVYQSVLRKAAAVIIIVMGVFMTGWLNMPILLREYRPFFHRGLNGAGGAFLLGCGFTLGWTPCTGPILATILLYAGDTATVGTGAFLLLIYSLGFGVPFFLLASIWRNKLVKLRGFYRYLPIVQRVTGTLLIILGIMLWRDTLSWLIQILPAGIGTWY